MSTERNQNTTDTKIIDYRHYGRLAQIRIYLGKLFRMFIFENDWKVVPMAALIAGVVAYVVGATMFKTLEGLTKGALALSCICIWNGFFNSIQVVCRERPIVKREHRAGLHISAYIGAHMIFQAFICLLQTIVTLAVLYGTHVNLRQEPLVTNNFLVDLGITIFLTTYAADMTSLFISCIVRTTTSAMTVMPLMLIIELVFSGSLFHLKNSIKWVENLMVSKWGINAICALGDYNNRPSVTAWNQIYALRNYEQDGVKPIKMITDYVEENDMVNELEMWVTSQNQNGNYARTIENVMGCWGHLILFALLFAILAMIVLEFIDRDKR